MELCYDHLFILPIVKYFLKVIKGAKIRNRYNQVPHLTQDTNGKVTNAQLDSTNESQEVNSHIGLGKSKPENIDR